MKTKGIPFALILLVGSLVAPITFSEAEVSSTPLAPTNLSATSVSSSKINLLWTAPINATISQVNGYKIEIDAGCFSTFSTLVTNTTTTSTTYSSTDLISGLCYQYRVSALNSVGSSTPSNIALATTWSVPNVPTNLIANAVSSSQINLSWSAPGNSGGTTINGYKIEKRNSCSGNFSVLVANTTNPNTTYSNTGLTNGTCYQYRVYALNAIGTSLSSNNATTVTLQLSVSNHVPSKPTGLTATAVSSSQINLSWAIPSNNGGSSITGYKIEFKLIPGNYALLTQINGNTTTTYSHTGLHSDKYYAYRVYAINSVGTSEPSSEALAQTLAQSSSITVPSATTGLKVNVLSNSSLKLTWNAPSNLGGATIIGYKIQRNGTTLVNNTGSAQTNYVNTGLTIGHQQIYRVAAWNSQGLGPYSNNAAGKTTIIQTIADLDNLGQQVSNFVQQRNAFFKQQRDETIKVIHECNDKFRNASPENRTQVKAECKDLLKVLKEKYKETRKQFKNDFKVFKETIKSQIKDAQKQKILDKKDVKDFNKDLKQVEKDIKKDEKRFNKEIKDIKKENKTKMKEKSKKDKSDKEHD